MHTAANEQTEPEELKGRRDGRAGLGEGSILRYPPLLPRGSEAFVSVQRPGQAWLTDRGRGPRADSQETGQELTQSYV